jgi:outer membrane protein OmpA-like peptidoglycan-associated protein
MDGQVIRQSSSYRQGLVLGLTMAEIMILLVFCLLIAMATFLRMEQTRRAELEALLNAEHVEHTRASAEPDDNGVDRELVEALKRNQELSERLQSLAKSGNAADADEFWRELVQARNAIAAAKERGLSEKDIHPALADAATLKAQGADAAEVARSMETIRSIQKIMTAAGEPATTPDAIAKVVERGLHPWPPIIKLSEADGYYFKTGSAELAPDFRTKLTESIPDQILASIKEYGVDVVEVVGHTDEQPVGSRPSNLDHDLVSVLKDDAGISTLVPADNAGLGLARAASVVSVLLRSPKLAGYKLIPLSGAQLVNVDESLALSGTPGDIRERRRIEIRLRKSAPQQGMVAKSSPVPLPAPKPRRRLSPHPVPPGNPASAAGSLNTSREH